MHALINIDVPDLAEGVRFYADAFSLTVKRRIGEGVAELGGLHAPVYLLQKPAGSIGAGGDTRQYTRHWTPVHLDIVVDNIDPALIRAVAAGAVAETHVQVEAWGKFAVLSDPFGHGLCLIQFLGRGYDEIMQSDVVS